MGIKSSFQGLARRLGRVFRGSSQTVPARVSQAKASSTSSASTDPPWVFNPTGSIRLYGESGALSKELATVWVYACVSLIARSVAAIPLKVTKGGELVDPKTDPLAKLLARPAPGWTGTRFREAMTLYMELTGSAYIQKVRVRSRGASQWMQHHRASGELGIPAELWPFGEDTYEAVINESAAVPSTGFVRPAVMYYRGQRGERQEVWDVIQTLFHRVGDGNEGEGLAPVDGARTEIASDEQAAAWQCSSFQNRAIPDGILTLALDTTVDQYDEVEAQISGRWAGPENARRTIVLGGDKSKYHALSRTAVEMDYANGRKLTREGICGGLGVPPVLVGILDRATYSNLKQAELVFNRSTVLPIAEMQVEALQRELAPEFGEDYEITLDRDAVDALLQLTAERWDVADKMWAKGVPMKQINDQLRLGLEPYPGWDVSYLPNSVQAVGRLEDEDAEDTPTTTNPILASRRRLRLVGKK